MATTLITMPSWRCPATEHQPSRSADTTPTSTVALCPGASDPEVAPFESTRSCSMSSSLVKWMTSLSPAGTSSVLGVNRSPAIDISTVVVCPVAWPLGALAANPTAPGSSATPIDIASTRMPAAAVTAPLRRGTGGGTARGFPRDAAPASGRILTRRAVATARTANTRNDAMVPMTRTDSARETKCGTGSSQSRMPALTTITRNSPARSSSRAEARAACGPPPSTTGTR